MRITVHLQSLEQCGCYRSIINSLSEVKNINDVEINEDKNTITFKYNTNHDFEAAKRLLSRIGYPIIGIESHL